MAVDLLRQGYSKEHASNLTGLTVRQISAMDRPDAGPTLRELVEASLERQAEPVAEEPPAPAKKKTTPRKRAAAKKQATSTRKKRTKASTTRKPRRPRLAVVADSDEQQAVATA